MTREDVLRTVLSTLSLFVGVVGLFGAVYFRRISRRSQKWPTTEGVVTASKVAEMPRIRYVPPYQARVSYRYSVGKRRYISTALNFDGGGYFSRSEAQRVVDRYPVGKQITVYYNPGDPTVAVLEPGGGGDSFTLSAGIGVLGLVMGLWVWWSF